MQIPWNAFWFIIGVSLLVTIHEFGHFWVARKLGFKVLRFSVGFGKPLYKKIGAAPDHIEYVIAAIPLGGYVRMLDERDGRVDPAMCRAHSAADRRGSASWCCWPVRRRTSFSRCWCSGACSGSTASRM
jgi:regulator of sigma E protease